jgi:hypothetical protein
VPKKKNSQTIATSPIGSHGITSQNSRNRTRLWVSVKRKGKKKGEGERGREMERERERETYQASRLANRISVTLSPALIRKGRDRK